MHHFGQAIIKGHLLIYTVILNLVMVKKGGEVEVVTVEASAV